MQNWKDAGYIALEEIEHGIYWGDWSISRTQLEDLFGRLIDKETLFPFVVGDRVYVISKHEIICCEIVSIRQGLRKTYNCHGRYANGRYYQGNFSDSSLGKTLFRTKEVAQMALEKKK